MSQIVEITAGTASRKETTFHGFSLTLTITTQNSLCTTQSVVFVSVLLEFRRIMNFWRLVDVQMSRVVSCCAGNIGADDGKQLLPPEAAARSSGGEVLIVARKHPTEDASHLTHEYFERAKANGRTSAEAVTSPHGDHLDQRSVVDLRRHRKLSRAHHREFSSRAASTNLLVKMLVPVARAS